jgi:hypothetical protein
MTKSSAKDSALTSASKEHKPEVLTSKANQLELDTRHDPYVLSDYGGGLFKHTNAKLIQLDIRDVDNKLIPPQKWYEALRPGTLVLATVTLHVYVMPDDRRTGEVKKVIIISLS